MSSTNHTMAQAELEHADDEIVVVEHDEGALGNESSASPTDEPKSVSDSSNAKKALIPLDEDALTREGLRLDSGTIYAEDSLLPMEGIDHVEKLRGRRSILLIILAIGCAAVMVLPIAIYLKILKAKVRIVPSIDFVDNEITTEVNHDQARHFAERFITRMNTWSSATVDYAQNVVLPLCSPEIRGGITTQFKKVHDGMRAKMKFQNTFVTASNFLGVVNDTVYGVMVVYETAETVEGGAKTLREVHDERRLAEIELIKSVKTEENPDGLEIIRLRDYSETEYKALGGVDVWEEVRKQSQAKKK